MSLQPIPVDLLMSIYEQLDGDLQDLVTVEQIRNYSTTNGLLYLINLQLANGVLSGAENGLSVVSRKVRLGGSNLDANTSIGGAFGLALNNAGASLAVGGELSTLAKILGIRTTVNPTNGLAGVISSHLVTPTADITAASIYGGRSDLHLNLTNAKVNAATGHNIAAHLSSLTVTGGATQSLTPVWAHRFSTVFNDAVKLAEVRVAGIKAPEFSGTGAAIANLYGLYIEGQKTSAITNAFGIYQAGANDANVFKGSATFDNVVNINFGLNVNVPIIMASSRNIVFGNAGRVDFPGNGGGINWYNGSGVLAASLVQTATGTITLSGKLVVTDAITPPTLTDAAAPNNSFYYSSTAGKLVYKDGAGVANSLY